MTDAIVVPAPLMAFASPQATLAAVGGKGANLARLALAGFPVPPGFLLPTSAYRQFVHDNRLDQTIRSALENLRSDDPAGLEAASQRIRAAFAVGVIAPSLSGVLADGYRALGAPPVAVRSSATAEDLPEMSFAGQQDTFLNVVGVGALAVAIVQCWSSLWTGRAIGYRARNNVDHGEVALAVVVQTMVQSEASGVLFTANPLNGRRSEIVIDATLGLGEALVSGQVEPDHYVVDAARGGLLRKTLGAKATLITSQPGGGVVTQAANAGQQQAIPDAVILELAQLGKRVAALYNSPQDIEWAWADGRLYLLQSRPITSLFPLPEGMPPEPLQVMFAFSSVQGVFEPFTPLGQDTLKYVLTGVGRAFGYDTTIDQQRTFLSAAERLYINVTQLLRNAIGRRVFPRLIRAVDPGVAQAFSEVVEDPRLAPKGRIIRLGTVRRILRFALPTAWRIRRVWQDPEGKRLQLEQNMDAKVAATEARTAQSGDMWTDYNRRLDLLLEARDLMPEMILPQGLTVVVAGMIPFFGILQRFAKQASAAAKQPEVALLPLEVARSLPHNVTTVMDLALWQTAQTLAGDEASASAFAIGSAAGLAGDYLNGRLPPVAQSAIADFMRLYGMRGLGEIDIGRPRWREQPEHIMQVLQSYLSIADPSKAPDAVFARGVRSAAEAAAQLEAVVRRTRGGWLKARLVRWAVTRYRALAGMREAPKFFAVRMMGIMRQGLLQSGEALVTAGLLQQRDDLFFLRVGELQEIGHRRDVSSALRMRIGERRGLHAREMRRRQLPRVLLSDGTAYYEGVRSAGGDAGVLVGDPVSPGVVEGVVHVVFNPNEAQLAPGEILVCPGTDPAWTPLFLAAGGLVMEVGGMMTHGSVVAREYGIPAVVGVHEATSRLKTGQRVRVDGSTGIVSLVDQSV